jgi:hypothetical protein
MADRSTTSLDTSASGVPWVMPSVADVIFVALLSVLVFTPLSVRLLGDAGIGWHIRAGQQILATHAVLRVDPFSSTMAGKRWYAWEWLYDVIVGQLETGLGLNGVVWLTAVMIAAIFAGAFRLLIRDGTHLCIALGLVLLATGAATIHFLTRPHVVSWLFTLAWFAILDSTERKTLTRHGQNFQSLESGLARRALWLLPLLMLVWVNVHGGFVIGFVLLAIFWLGAAWKWFHANGQRIEEALEKLAGRQRTFDLTLVALLSAAVSFVNPYGWKLHAHIYHYLSDRFLMNHIEEFRSPDFHGIAQRCFLILLLIAIATLAARGREMRMSGLLTVLFAVYAGLYATRNIPVSALLLALVTGPLLATGNSAGLAPGTDRLSFFQRMSNIESRLRRHLWPVLALVVTLVIAANGGRIGQTTLMAAHFDPRRMPVEAVDHFAQFGVRGPVLSPDYWGGYLIYRLYPKMQVVVDDRHDLYGSKFFKSYLTLIRAEPGWEEFLRDHPPGCVLLPKNAALTAVLVESPNWKQVYSDDTAVVFVKRMLN